MTFKKNKYLVIKNVINKDLATFLANYFVIKKQVYDTCIKARYISPFENAFGSYEKGNQQVPDTYAHYSDVAFETLMLKIQPIMEKETKLKLNPAYTYARIYKKGDELKRHKDRFSCEISTTINIEPSGDVNKKGIKVNLNPGDMLVYRGCDLEHWREKFKGEECVQAFLHYNDISTQGASKNKFDQRPHLGLPSWFRE